MVLVPNSGKALSAKPGQLAGRYINTRFDLKHIHIKEIRMTDTLSSAPSTAVTNEAVSNEVADALTRETTAQQALNDFRSAVGTDNEADAWATYVRARDAAAIR